MASVVGRPIATDKATQDKTMPRVKVILDLVDKLPKRMRLQYLDEQTSKIQEVFQEFVYDNLPLYCNHCKHQGHDENCCRLILKKNQDNNHKDNGVVGDEQFNGEKFQATVSQTLLLNAKDGVTSDSVVPVINLESNLVSNPKLPTTGVLSGKDPILVTIEDSGQANKVQQCEDNLDQIFEFGVAWRANIWTTINQSLGKETSDSRWADLAEEEKHISAPARSNLSPQAPIFVPSSKANSSMAVTIDNSKKILTITTKVLKKSHEPEAEVSRLSPTTTYDSDLGSEKFDEDDMLDILFDKVANDRDLSSRKQRSESNKNKKKTHERQHSWDGKVTEEFIPRHLPSAD
uniref:NB-ARC domain containing protein n=1 Tax=Solanum tuberosum TaxID=4113 RepID=M1DHA4_SOLTU